MRETAHKRTNYTEQIMRDTYTEITEKIIAQLEAGVVPWVKPWQAGAVGSAFGVPANYSTGRAYRGVNVLLLWSAGYPDQRWLTYNQARAAGGNVRKGEKGTQIVLFKPYEVRDVKRDDGATKMIPLIRSFTVFNIAQIDGLPGEAPAGPVAEPAPITYTKATALLAQAKVVHGGGRACYIPSVDRIHLPELVAFESEAAYWGTALHELTHWSGHESRLNRLEKLARFSDESHAREELVAEMGAAFLCAQVGIGYEARHADYIGHWLKVLKGDKKAIVQAASLAQAAADFINPAEVAEIDEAA